MSTPRATLSDEVRALWPELGATVDAVNKMSEAQAKPDPNEPVRCPDCFADAFFIGEVGIAIWYECHYCGKTFRIE